MSCLLSVAVSCNELCAVLSVVVADQLLDWVTHSTQSWWDGNLATPVELAQGHFLVYTVCCESSESAIKGGEARVIAGLQCAAGLIWLVCAVLWAVRTKRERCPGELTAAEEHWCCAAAASEGIQIPRPALHRHKISHSSSTSMQRANLEALPWAGPQRG